MGIDLLRVPSGGEYAMTDHSSKITRIRLEHFTGFDTLDLRPSPGINVLVGANGTGKTHLMKVAYAACDATKPAGTRFADKLTRVFLPTERRIGRLAKRRQGGSQALVEVWLGKKRAIRASFSNRTKSPESVKVLRRKWPGVEVSSVYIPVKEMLANAPGFRSLYAERKIHFEEIYRDILDRAYLPPFLGAPDAQRRHVLGTLKRVLNGKIELKNEEFFLAGARGRLEFTLLAEGLRKLGLLWLLLQNGTLLKGSVLFWDEPETNLNPKLFGPVVEILLELQRLGVQVFIATHDYVILKQLDLQAASDDEIAYHALHQDDGTGALVCNTTDSYLGIDPNMISEAFTEIYDLEIRRSLGEGS